MVVVKMDPEVGAAMAPVAEMAARKVPPPGADWRARRAFADDLFGSATATWSLPDDVGTQDQTATAPDGSPVGLRLYRRDGDQPGSLALYIHGGGMFSCSLATHDPICRLYTHLSGVPLVSVDFRFAPEHPYPTSVEDCYAALQWVAGHAAEMEVDPARIAIMGDSAGGAMAAGVALMARDRGGPALAAQLLIYPMLDDRTSTVDPEIEPFAVWSLDENTFGWACLLGDAAGGPDVPAYAAPARATDLSGLPPAFIDVGQLDILRDEAIDYAVRLQRAGVGVELQLYPGVSHAFDVFAPAAAVSRRAMSARARVLQDL